MRRTSRHVMHFGVLMLATLLVSSLPLPWQAAALLFAIAALVEGIRGLRSAWTAGVRGALVPMLVMGIAASSLLTVGTAGMIALWPIQMERQTCLRDALTISSQEQCENAYQASLDSLRSRLSGTTTP